MRAALRTAIVVLLSTIVALGLGTAAQAAGGTTSDGAEGGQVWGFIDTPASVDAGWQGPLVVAMRNVGDEARDYRVTLTGHGLAGAPYAWSRTITLESGGSFREELVPPALVQDGRYEARLSWAGSDLVQPVTITVGDEAPALRVLQLRRSAGALSPESTRAARRAVATTFRVSRQAQVTASVVDAHGRTVVRRALGTRAPGATQRWSWDGHGATGRTVAAGSYTIRVTAAADGARSSAQVSVLVRR